MRCCLNISLQNTHTHLKSALINIFIIIIFLLFITIEVILITEKQLLKLKLLLKVTVMLLSKGKCSKVDPPIDLKFFFHLEQLILPTLWLLFNKTNPISKSLSRGGKPEFSSVWEEKGKHIELLQGQETWYCSQKLLAMCKSVQINRETT